MCGIVGYIGKRPGASIIVDGLQTLEYRGYDSAGLALIDDDVTVIKHVGRVKNLAADLEKTTQTASLAIGHTRWATHGAPSTINAHPHQNTDGTIFVVHNGIIENHQVIRDRLVEAGYVFVSETDTEVLPHLIDFYFKELNDLQEAFKAALRDVNGAYAIAMASSLRPDVLFAARLSSPLVIGVGKDEYIIASDASAINAHTDKVIYLDDFDVAVISRKNYELTNLHDSKPVSRELELLDTQDRGTGLGDYPNFMLKEIYEAPATIQNAILGRALADQNIIKLGGLESVVEQLRYIDRIVIVACGTSYYAGMVGEYLIEELAGIPVEVQLASEFKYRTEPFSRSTAILAISQSGETADTISALKKVEGYGMLRLGVVNAVGSTIARMTDAGVYCHAGPEMAVASTKAFISQVTVLSLIALHLSSGASVEYSALLKELESLSAKAAETLKQADNIKEIALRYADGRDFMYIGRTLSYPAALEGSLKLKEISYIHAEGYAAGEMKHGPLAMIDKDFPSLAIATDETLLEKTYANMAEIRARQGRVIAIATAGNTEITKHADDVLYIPQTHRLAQPILSAIVMQLFAYYIAEARGLDVDKPRNLAKSVTVE